MENKKVNIKKRKRKKKIVGRKVNKKLLLFVTFLTTILLIISSYAWLSASLDVKIKFFDLKVSTDNGLFISLDGVNFSDNVEVSYDSIINSIKNTYPSNTNQWASGGLWPASSNGIKTSNNDKFDMYLGEVSKFRLKRKNRKFLNTTLIEEDSSSANNIFISFDIFLKNVSGSPNSDNLYFADGTDIDFEDDTTDEIKESMSNIMNSMRLGLVKIGSVSTKASVESIQNIKCNNGCSSLIYEPNKTSHSVDSITKASDYGITLVDGVYSPTYGVIGAGQYLEHTNGQEGSGIALDTEHFQLQNTITDSDFDRPIYQIPDGITKMRVYVWIEGQDVDSLETNSKGAKIYVSVDFEKDLAGYE